MAIFLLFLFMAQAAAPRISGPGSGNLADNGPKIDMEKAKAFKPSHNEFGQPKLEGIWQPRASGAAFSVLPHAGGFFWDRDRRRASWRAVFCPISRGQRNK